MADSRISQLNELASDDIALADLLAIVDSSATETKKVTIESLDERWKNGTQNIVAVQKDPGADQFSTIQAALDSITDATALKPYTLEVGPGIYTESITLKPFVQVCGSGQESTIIQPTNLNQNAVTAAANSRICNVKIEGSTGALVSGIEVNSISGLFIISDVSFGSNTTQINAVSGGLDQVVYIRNTTISHGASFTTGIKADGSNAGEHRIFIDSLLYNRPTTVTGAFTGIHILGSQAEAELNNITMLDNNESTGLKIETGARVILNGFSATNFNQGIFLPNNGTGTILSGHGLHISSGTEHIRIDSTSAQVTLTGCFARGKTFVDTSATVGMAHLDGETQDYEVIGEFRQADRFDRSMNLSKLVRSASTLGLNDGGAISINAGLSVDVAAGSGFLSDMTDDFIKEVSWSANTLSLPSNSTSYIYIDTNSTIQTSSSQPVLENVVLLGRVVTQGASVDFIDRSVVKMTHHGNSIEDSWRRSLGPVYASGSAVSENGSNDKKLDITSGAYNFGSVEFSPSGGTEVEWLAHYRDGGGDFTRVTQDTVTAQYDNNSGTLQNLSTGNYAKHSLYIIGDGVDEKYLLVYSQAEYGTEHAAIDADIPTPPTSFVDSVSLIATVIIQEGQANLTRITDERPVIGFKSSGTSPSSSHSSLTDLTNDDHTQYLLVSGARALSGNLNLGTNNIVNVGTVNGVTVESHQSRHVPGGADALPTGVPSNVGTTNQEGTEASFARRDHIHAHGNQAGGALHAVATPSVSGFMLSTDKSKLDSIENNAKDDQDASEVSFTPAGDVAATDVQAAIEELDTEKLVNTRAAVKTALGTDSITDNTGADVAIDWTETIIQKKTITTGTSVLTFTNPAQPSDLTLILDNSAGGSFTLPAITWQAGIAPDFSVQDVYIITLLFDGTTYFGSFGRF